jgi:hypothetical protein
MSQPMSRRHVLAAGVLVIVLGIASCTAGPPSAAPLHATQKSGTLSASLALKPDPPVPMQEARLQLALFNDRQQPILGADVSLDLTMPEMEMPVNRPAVIEDGGGGYQATTLFTMAGKWQITAVVVHAGQRETFVFDVNTR